MTTTNKRWRPIATIPTEAQWGIYTWQGQAEQYKLEDTPGMHYFAGYLHGYKVPVNCLLWYDDAGKLAGILNHYPIDYPPDEIKGGVNTWVRPDAQRQGIARKLHEECNRRWGPIDYTIQRYTMAGAKFVRNFLGI